MLGHYTCITWPRCRGGLYGIALHLDLDLEHSRTSYAYLHRRVVLDDSNDHPLIAYIGRLNTRVVKLLPSFRN